MSDRKSVAAMIGDGLREGGVLVAVFGMLDKFVHGEGPTTTWTTAVVATSLSLFLVGSTLERQRL